MKNRIQSVDALRGAVMIVMALDHVRDFINSAAMSFSPTDLLRTTAAIFFTRWVTHFCAPTFAFTAGIGAFLWLQRGRTKAELSRFLLTRGPWLMVLDPTVVRFLLTLETRFNEGVIILNVFWMLGLSMVVLAGLIYLPVRWLAVLSLVTIAGHNLLDSVVQAGWAWDILHNPAAFRFHGATLHVAYPLIPWVAVMAAGYCFGSVLLWTPVRRRRLLLTLGVALSIAFVLLRAWNYYGDPMPWSIQRSTLFTVLSFLNCTKYPPSLLFLLMTIGTALIAMAWLDREWSFTNPLIVFGRAPFFFFLGHLALVHTLTILLGFLRYGWQSFLLMPGPAIGGPRQLFPLDYGYDLWVAYLAWFAVIVLMYPACRWYVQMKQRRKSWWLSYL